jgi:hypothetical protein
MNAQLVNPSAFLAMLNPGCDERPRSTRSFLRVTSYARLRLAGARPFLGTLWPSSLRPGAEAGHGQVQRRHA